MLNTLSLPLCYSMLLVEIDDGMTKRAEFVFPPHSPAYSQNSPSEQPCKAACTSNICEKQAQKVKKQLFKL